MLVLLTPRHEPMIANHAQRRRRLAEISLDESAKTGRPSEFEFHRSAAALVYRIIRKRDETSVRHGRIREVAIRRPTASHVVNRRAGAYFVITARILRSVITDQKSGPPAHLPSANFAESSRYSRTPAANRIAELLDTPIG
jgi:hypothetical protein